MARFVVEGIVVASIPLVKAVAISLKSHPVLNERWVQEQIAGDPSILGLGTVDLRDKERPQPRAGRLDLLLQDREDDRRYEVEIQLGPTDEAHIIRCIEYWDIEKKRYPQYDHCAVLIAEDVTSRFLNVLGLFNGHIPIIVLQMRAFQVGDGIMLVFTRVLDELRRGLVDEDEETSEPADRKYWEERVGPAQMKVADSLYDLARSFAPGVAMTYLKGHLGASVNGKTVNFMSMSPKRKFIRFTLRLPQSDATEKRIEDAGLDSMGFKAWGAYQIRLSADDVKKHAEFLRSLIKEAYEYFAV